MTNILDTLQGARLERLFFLMRKSTEPESTGLGAEGVVDLIYEMGKSVYDTLTANGNEIIKNMPSRLDVAARPAYHLALLLSAAALFYRPGPLLAQSKLSRTSYVGDNLTWKFVAVSGDNEVQPYDADKIEFEIMIRPPAASAANATGQRWYFNLDGASHQAQNVVECGSLYYVSIRARFVDSNLLPVSVWAYSNEEIPANLPAS